MYIYLLLILFVYIIWKLKDYFNFNEEIFIFLRSSAEKFQTSYVNWYFGLWSFEVCRAKDAERILGSTKHVDKSGIYNLIHPFLKTGLLTSNGEKWHKRRKLLTPAFHFDILKEYLEVFKEVSDRLVSSLKYLQGTDVDVIPIATQFALNTICESAMGVKLSSLGNDGVIYRNNIYEVGRLLLFRLLKPWLHDFIYSLLGYWKQLDEVLKPVLEFTKQIIKQRRNNFINDKNETLEVHDETDDNDNVYFRPKKRRCAMLDTLLQAESHGLIDDEGVIDETDTFTFEGHDTTSSAMTFTLLLLAQHPDVQEALYSEMKEVLPDKKELTIDNFNKLEYMDRVIKESLRVYPPVSFISRELAEDLTHDGFIQPKGTICNIHIFDVYRDPVIWKDPDTFDPNRFLPENCANRNNFAFIAFSAGMRNCIGQRFAMLELKTILWKLILNFKIFPVTKREDVILLGDLVLRSKYPIKMNFFPKN